MKKALVLILAIGLAVALLAIAGCGDDSTTIQTPEGEITLEDEGGTITFEGDEGSGSIDITDEPPSEEELGAPVYPGAEYVPGSGGTMTSTTEEGDFATASATFSTDDSFEDVVAWYTDELGEEALEMSTGGIREAGWFLGDEETDFVSVSVTEEDGEVLIIIGRMMGSE